MNGQRGYVAVHLDKERRLKFDLNALALIEEKLGVPISEFQGRLASPSMRDVRTIVWAGLVHEDEQLTERQVGAIVDVSNLDAVASAILAAFGAAFGAVGGPGKNASRPKRSTGSAPSGPASAPSASSPTSSGG